MKKPRDPEALLAAYLAGGMEVLPDRVVDSVLDEIHRTHQRAVFGSWRTRSVFRLSLAAAAVVVVLVSGALLMSRPDQPSIGNPSPSLPGVTAPSSTPGATPSAEVSPTPDAHSLKVTWTKVALDGHATQVAWLGDRFVLVDEDSGTVRTSPDGASWRVLQQGDYDPGYLELLRDSFVSWEDDVVGWWNPEDGPDVTGKPPITARDIIRIVRPPAAPTQTTPFKGRIESIGIGPAGIVAFVHSHLDWDAWVASKLGDNWVSHYTGVDFKDGILTIGMDNGPGLKVVWADQGFEPGDYQDAGFGWYSPDGEQWTAIPRFGDVVGVSDGFIARAEGILHSSDGVTWRDLGVPDACSLDCQVLPWRGGALVTDGIKRFDVWTSDGHSELPMAAELPAVPEPQNPTVGIAVGTGPLGLVTVLKDDKKILVTRDGVDGDIRPMPAEMAAVSAVDLSPTVAVGERSVLIMLWTGSYEEGYAPSLWRGTLEP